ncbi:winged helix-turn-helix domain-containing protein [Halobacterium sp. R2-5]|uniref:winged helix-turn-helix domain-containing protein n=1 Tax=Halobacterium sp. R2-5 TaxID=2715751 RepID=UPI00141EBD3D|nr:winged helix-turn-helix domain-containing protein [Halobacterium sp. R2-5]NIC01076.1 MarR family transcriptional regulator [Halobacterium sp. R2-5]
MRPRVEWMTRADDYILEFFEETEIVATPHVVAANIDYSRQYVNRRIRKLADHDLVENTDDGLYRITDRGRGYLTGDIDPDDLSR